MENIIEYEPFGDEWEKEMMKFEKPYLIELLRQALLATQTFVIMSEPAKGESMFLKHLLVELDNGN